MESNTNTSNINLDVAIANQGGTHRFADDEARGIRDPRTGRFMQHQDIGEDTKLNVKFSAEPVFSKRETYFAGGVPKYVDMDFITITIPGNRDLIVHTPVTDFYIWRFPQEYEAYKRGQEASVVGTPLEMWPGLQPSQVAELKHQGIRTVEQLATLSDTSSGVLRGFYAMKHKAQQFLDDAKDKTATAFVRAQMEEQNERHQAELKAVEERFAAMLAEAMATKDSKKSKPSEGGSGS
ncbi:hypothetical protein [Massilia suwonensis]|uniref:Uncharacterized protein n=1 Tax=Massilia suwonensis TaxID=648895 RepID=A0ABW0MGZ3_9BURK